MDAEGKPCHVHGISVALDGGEPVRKEFDVTVCAQDVPGIKKLLPESFRKHDQFDKIYKLEGVPVATVQLRFDGWVTEMQDMEAMKHVKADLSDGKAAGIDNLLYSADAEFSSTRTKSVGSAAAAGLPCVSPPWYQRRRYVRTFRRCFHSVSTLEPRGSSMRAAATASGRRPCRVGSRLGVGVGSHWGWRRLGGERQR